MLSSSKCVTGIAHAGHGPVSYGITRSLEIRNNMLISCLFGILKVFFNDF